MSSQPPQVDQVKIREAVLALEGALISDLTLPLPGDLRALSKAAALVSGIIEDRIPELLNRVRSTTWDEDGALHPYEFRKFPIGFPDVLLVERANPDNFIFELEAKSWYLLSTDPMTARFETSTDVIRPGTLVVLVAWMLDGVVSGSPVLLRIHVDDAMRLASVRDQKWVGIDQATHRVVQPINPEGTSRSQIQTQATGEIFRGDRWVKDSDNYGKLQRLYDDDLAAFRDAVWSLTAAGKSLKEWRAFIRKRPSQAQMEIADDW